MQKRPSMIAGNSRIPRRTAIISASISIPAAVAVILVIVFWAYPAATGTEPPSLTPPQGGGAPVAPPVSYLSNEDANDFVHECYDDLQQYISHTSIPIKTYDNWVRHVIVEQYVTYYERFSFCYGDNAEAAVTGKMQSSWNVTMARLSAVFVVNANETDTQTYEASGIYLFRIPSTYVIPEATSISYSIVILPGQYVNATLLFDLGFPVQKI